VAKGDCPYCRQPGAVRILWSVRCPNGACPKYDPTLAKRQMQAAVARRKGGPVPFEWNSRRTTGVFLMLLGLALFVMLHGFIGLVVGGSVAVRGFKMMDLGEWLKGAEQAARQGREEEEGKESGEREVWSSGSMDDIEKEEKREEFEMDEEMRKQDEEQKRRSADENRLN